MSLADLRRELKHRHLPVLSTSGFVDWATEPFCVQRGVRCEETAVVVDRLQENATRLPESLVDGWPRFEMDPGN